jgi:hypothetical protein
MTWLLYFRDQVEKDHVVAVAIAAYTHGENYVDKMAFLLLVKWFVVV